MARFFFLGLQKRRKLIYKINPDSLVRRTHDMPLFSLVIALRLRQDERITQVNFATVCILAFLHWRNP